MKVIETLKGFGTEASISRVLSARYGRLSANGMKSIDVDCLISPGPDARQPMPALFRVTDMTIHVGIGGAKEEARFIGHVQKPSFHLDGAAGGRVDRKTSTAATELIEAHILRAGTFSSQLCGEGDFLDMLAVVAAASNLQVSVNLRPDQPCAAMKGPEGTYILATTPIVMMTDKWLSEVRPAKHGWTKDGHVWLKAMQDGRKATSHERLAALARLEGIADAGAGSGPMPAVNAQNIFDAASSV